jgi:hypothetical protein
MLIELDRRLRAVSLLLSVHVMPTATRPEALNMLHVELLGAHLLFVDFEFSLTKYLY